jgi:hypothetical protein
LPGYFEVDWKWKLPTLKPSYTRLSFHPGNNYLGNLAGLCYKLSNVTRVYYFSKSKNWEGMIRLKKVKHLKLCISVALLLAVLSFALIPGWTGKVDTALQPQVSTGNVNVEESFNSNNSGTPAGLDIQTAGVSRKRVVLASGTAYATSLYIIKSGKPGPVVMIVGGVHGNETAGYRAARIVKNYTIKKGTLLVLPDANKLAIQQHRRSARGKANLNRSFPTSKYQSGDTVLARAIYSTVKKYDVDWLMDMHEGYDYAKSKKSSSVGQSLIYYPRGNTRTVASSIVSRLNSSISSSYRKFILLQYPVTGSLARSAGAYQGVHSFIFETCSKDKLSTRINNQLKAANILLSKLGMK